MSAMVMNADQGQGSGIFQRYPTPPPSLNYPFNGFGYPSASAQHPQDYSHFQVADPTGVHHPHWYNMYAPRTDDWSYCPNGTMTAAATTMASSPGMSAGYSYRTANMDYTPPCTQVPTDSLGDTSSSSSNAGSPTNKQLRPPFDWMKKATYQSAPTSGKTRTKDKYRVVYSDHQRLELEKEFHYSRYITIRRKAELAQTLALSERQVKIWFQNRRAKERKQNKKRDDTQMIKMLPDLGDFTDDTKQHVQQVNMQMTSGGPQHHVHASPVTQTGPYSYTGDGLLHMTSHVSHGGALPVQSHPGQQPYASSGHIASSPRMEASHMSPASTPTSPNTSAIKTDIDALGEHVS